MDKTELALLNSAAKSRQKLAKKSKALPKGEGSAVVYLGHIPHGFYEDQMRGFFSQFGEIKRLRLSRSKKTGRSRGYAFVEFQSPEISKIVADTMDNYFLADSYLVCNVLSRTQVHDKLFDGADSTFRKVPWRTIAKQQANKGRTEEQKVKHARKVLDKAEAKRAKLAAAGIEYEFAGVSLDVSQISAKSSTGSAVASAGETSAAAASRGRKRARSEEDSEEAAPAAAAAGSSDAVSKTPAKTPAKKAAASAKKTPARTTGRKTKTRRTEEDTASTPAAAASAAVVTPAAVTPDGKLPDPSPPMTRSRRKTKSATSAKKTPSRK